MKLYTAPTPASAAVLLSVLIGGGSGGVQSFQLAAPSITAGSAATHAAASVGAVEPRKVWTPQLLSSSFALHSTSSPQESDIDQAELELSLKKELEDDEQTQALEKRLEEIAKELDLAKQRNDEVRGNVETLRDEKKSTEKENESFIDRLKRSFMEDIDDLSDKVEGTQDSLRKTFTQTRSQISDIKGDVAQREAELKAELADLESKLRGVKSEAAKAARERNKVKSSIQREVRTASAAPRKDVEKARAEAAAEKKRLTYDNWELESRIEQAKEDAKPALLELEEAKKGNMPALTTLKDQLARLKNKFNPQIEDLKEQRAAKEMFFDKSLKDIKLDKETDLDTAKSVFNEEIAEEDAKTAEAKTSFEKLLAEKEEEMQLGNELLYEPVEMSGFGAISRAQEAMSNLLKQKTDDIANQKVESNRAVQDVVEAQSATQDKYDADIENAKRNLDAEKQKSERKLRKEDSRREGRKAQLQSQKEELVRKLDQLTEDERVKAEADLDELRVAKVTQLDDSNIRVNIASNEIQTMRSNLNLVRYELTQLESTSQKKQVVIEELEEERASFRKQAKRTMRVAFDRIRRR